MSKGGGGGRANEGVLGELFAYGRCGVGEGGMGDGNLRKRVADTDVGGAEDALHRGHDAHGAVGQNEHTRGGRPERLSRGRLDDGSPLPHSLHRCGGVSTKCV